MICPCCEEDDRLDEDDVDELQPGDNHVAFSAGAVVYPSAGGPTSRDRQRHATAAKRRGAATETVVTGLPFLDYFPAFTADRGGIQLKGVAS